MKFMEPLHLSPHYCEILRFECLLERYGDLRNIAIAGGLACFELAFASGNVFPMLVGWYMGEVRESINGWFGEFQSKEVKGMDGVLGALIPSVGWIVVLVWFVVTCKVVYGLAMQLMEIVKMLRRQRTEHLSKV